MYRYPVLVSVISLLSCTFATAAKELFPPRMFSGFLEFAETLTTISVLNYRNQNFLHRYFVLLAKAAFNSQIEHWLIVFFNVAAHSHNPAYGFIGTINALSVKVYGGRIFGAARKVLCFFHNPAAIAGACTCW